MLRKSAWMLAFAAIVAITTVLGCASRRPGGATGSGSSHPAAAAAAPSGGSCH